MNNYKIWRNKVKSLIFKNLLVLHLTLPQTTVNTKMET